jgi:hypothetical protein
VRILNQLFIFVAASIATFGQGTIHINFNALPVGAVIGEQFADQGVHFLQDERYNSPHVWSSAEVPGAPYPKAGFAGSRAMGILIDQPITSFSMTYALIPLVPTLGLTSLWINGLNSSSTGNFWDMFQGSPQKTWQTTETFVAPGEYVQNIRILAFLARDNQGGEAGIFFTDLRITTIPEPATTTLLCRGIALFAALYAGSRRRSFTEGCGS